MAPPLESPCRLVSGAIVLRVRLTPKGGRDAIEGLTSTPDGPAIKAKVRAAPEDNAANDALTNLVAQWLGVGRRQVSLVSGHKSRTKSVAIAGDRAEIESLIAMRIAALEP